MIAFDFMIEEGYILSLTELHQHLRLASHHNHQWVAHVLPRPVWTRKREPRLYVIVGYTNPEPLGAPNYICYLFPLLDLGLGTGINFQSQVCLHPAVAITLVQGVYPEKETMKHDLLEDWSRFWPPLKRTLHSPAEQTLQTNTPG